MDRQHRNLIFLCRSPKIGMENTRAEWPTKFRVSHINPRCRFFLSRMLRLTVRCSPVHSMGMFALRPIAAGERTQAVKQETLALLDYGVGIEGLA